MKYYFIAGEASGDVHSSKLIEEIKKVDENSSFRGFGGDLMKDQGTHLVKHYKDLAFMGFEQVVMNLRTILNNIELCKKDILNFKPNVIILVDYPGFNMRIARWAKKRNLKVYYYIPPTIWAWNVKRVYEIKKNVDEVFVIYPFEKEFYKKFEVDVHFMGHPLAEEISQRQKPTVESFCQTHNLSSKPIIALLPGSRKQEISAILKPMLSIVDDFPEYQFVIAGAPSLPISFYRQFMDKNIPILNQATYDLLEQSTAALVTSGTATLETALFNVPQVVCYKTSPLFYSLAKMVIKINYISIVNIISNKKVVTELIQKELSRPNLISEMKKLLNPETRQVMINDYNDLKSILGTGNAPKKIAKSIVDKLTS